MPLRRILVQAAPDPPGPTGFRRAWRGGVPSLPRVRGGTVKRGSAPPVRAVLQRNLAVGLFRTPSHVSSTAISSGHAWMKTPRVHDPPELPWVALLHPRSAGRTNDQG